MKMVRATQTRLCGVRENVQAIVDASYEKDEFAISIPNYGILSMSMKEISDLIGKEWERYWRDKE